MAHVNEHSARTRNKHAEGEVLRCLGGYSGREREQARARNRARSGKERERDGRGSEEAREWKEGRRRRTTRTAEKKYADFPAKILSASEQNHSRRLIHSMAFILSTNPISVFEDIFVGLIILLQTNSSIVIPQRCRYHFSGARDCAHRIVSCLLRMNIRWMMLSFWATFISYIAHT